MNVCQHAHERLPGVRLDAHEVVEAVAVGALQLDADAQRPVLGYGQARRWLRLPAAHAGHQDGAHRAGDGLARCRAGAGRRGWRSASAARRSGWRRCRRGRRRPSPSRAQWPWVRARCPPRRAGGARWCGLRSTWVSSSSQRTEPSGHVTSGRACTGAAVPCSSTTFTAAPARSSPRANGTLTVSGQRWRSRPSGSRTVTPIGANASARRGQNGGERTARAQRRGGSWVFAYAYPAAARARNAAAPPPAPSAVR